MNKQQVMTRIGKKNWPAFLRFMRGQTVGVYLSRGKPVIDYYESDVERFMATEMDY